MWRTASGTERSGDPEDRRSVTDPKRDAREKGAKGRAGGNWSCEKCRCSQSQKRRNGNCHKRTHSQKGKLKSADKRIRKLENISKEIEYSTETDEKGIKRHVDRVWGLRYD